MRFSDEVLIAAHLRQLTTKQAHRKYFQEIANKITQHRNGHSQYQTLVQPEHSNDDDDDDDDDADADDDIEDKL